MPTVNPACERVAVGRLTASLLSGVPLGTVAGLASVHLVSATHEWMVWVALVVATGALIAVASRSSSFADAAIVSIPVGICVTACHLIYIDRYWTDRPDEAAWMLRLGVAHSLSGLIVAVAPIYWMVLTVLGWGLARLFNWWGLGGVSAEPPRLSVDL